MGCVHVSNRTHDYDDVVDELKRHAERAMRQTEVDTDITSEQSRTIPAAVVNDKP
jgi:hypothetical protein